MYPCSYLSIYLCYLSIYPCYCTYLSISARSIHKRADVSGRPTLALSFKSDTGQASPVLGDASILRRLLA